MAQPAGPRCGIIRPMGLPSAPTSAALADVADRIVIRPMWSLWLLSIAHAVNHAQAVLLPLIYLKIIDDSTSRSRRSPSSPRSAPSRGAVQLSYASLTRRFSRRRLLGAGGLLFGGGFVAQAFATTLRRPSPWPTSCRGSAARRSTRSATASWPSSSRPSGGVSRSAPTSPAAT